MNRWIAFILIMISYINSFAQGSNALHIQLLSKADQKPIAGASLNSITESTIATKTDREGKSHINKITYPISLRFSHLSYAPKIVQFDRPGEYTVELESNVQELEEAVVQTGYQAIPKERATGSFSFLTNKELNRRPSEGLVDRLEGTVSGLTIDSRLSGRNALMLRGYATIKSDNTPLIILDGAPFEGDITALDPNALESITFLKDAAASSIWGARAGNGVLVITSKSAKLNEGTKVNLSLNNTWEAAPERYYSKFLLNSNDFIGFEQYLYDNGYYNAQKANAGYRKFTPVVELLLKRDKGLLSAEEVSNQIAGLAQQDVRKDLDRYYFGTGYKQQYNAQISNGNAKAANLLSLTWNKANTSADRQKDSRILLQFNSTFKPAEWLDFNPTLSWNLGNQNNRLLNYADYIYPYAKLADENGNYLPVIHDYNGIFLDAQKQSGRLDWDYSPLDEMDKRLFSNEHNEFIAGFNSNIRLVYGLTAQLLYNYQNINDLQTFNYDRDSYYARNLVNSFAYENNGQLLFPIREGAILDKSRSKTQAHLGRAQLNYSATIGLSNINLLLGAEVKQTTLVGDKSTVYGFDPETLTYQDMDFSTRFTRFPTSLKSNIPSGIAFTDRIDRFVSYYFNGSYLYRQRYLLSFSARKDASNLFGVNTNQRAVPLWSSGLAWTASEERFWPKDFIVEYLKLRTTFGYSGNVNKSLTRYSTARYSTSLLTGLPSAQIQTPPNEDLRWEKVSTVNIGLDLATKNRAVSLSFDYYQKKGRDLIGESALDPTTGFFVGQRFSFTGNTASLNTEGIDLRIDGRKNFAAVEWMPSLLFNWNRNKVMKFSGTAPSSLLASSFAVPVEGKPMSPLYSVPWAGLDPVDGSPRFWYKGEISKDYTAIRSKMTFDDLQYHGSALPLYTGSLINRLKYKSFDLSFSMLYAFGGYLRRPTITYSTLATNWFGHEDYTKRWIKPGDELETDVPAIPKVADLDKWSILNSYSSVLVEKADYIFLKDVRLGIDLRTLNNTWLNRSFKNASFFVLVNNIGQLWVANSAKIDPMTNESYLGRPRLWSIGINVGL